MTALEESREYLARLCSIYFDHYEGRSKHQAPGVPRADSLRIAESDLAEALEGVRVYRDDAPSESTPPKPNYQACEETIVALEMAYSTLSAIAIFHNLEYISKAPGMKQIEAAIAKARITK